MRFYVALVLLYDSFEFGIALIARGSSTLSKGGDGDHAPDFALLETTPNYFIVAFRSESHPSFHS